MFYLFEMLKRWTFGHFFNVLRGQIIFHQKGGHVLQKEDVR